LGIADNTADIPKAPLLTPVAVIAREIMLAHGLRAIVYYVPHHWIAEGALIERRREMAREKPLDLAVVKTWLASWDEGDLFSDAAVQRLQSLIADTHCLVVVTLGAGRGPRSLVFRRRKYVHFYDVKPDIFRPLPSMLVSPVAPVAAIVGQLWHQTGAKSEAVPKLERVLQWDGADWVIAGHVCDSPIIMKQGKHACDFNEALAHTHGSTEWWDCKFIYTYDESTWGSA
jgi:hypothetical protein